MTTQADLIIIGGGPGGYEIAAAEAARGQKVVLIEKDRLGGTCLNRGCIPTKCLCASADAAMTVASAAAFGVNVDGVSLDYGRAVERMRGIVDALRDDVTALTSGCEVVHAEATVNADGTVSADGRVYAADKVIIATGSKAARLPVPGAELAMTSDEILTMETLPVSLCVIGGGVIGLEFASIMSAFGVEVTVIEYCKEILPPFDREVAKRLRTLLSRRGIKFVTGAAVTAIAKNGDGAFTVTYQGKKGDTDMTAAAVLMAVGRRPVVPAGLADAGIETDRRGFIVTDDNMATTRKGFYAVGDCNGRLMLAHAAAAQARLATGHAVDLRYIPSAVFTAPEAAMVGLTAEQCDETGIAYASAKAMFAGNGKARAMGQGDGIVKILYDPETHVLLGCHIVGPHAADLITEAVTAMHTGLTAEAIAHTLVHGHPTLSEVVAAAAANAR